MISKKRFPIKRKIDDTFGKLLFNTLKSRKKKSFPKKIDKIIIFKLSTLGDSLLSLPSIKSLKEKTGAKIVLVHSGDNKEIFRNLDFIDEKILLDVSRNNPLQILKTLSKLKKQKADISVDLSHTGNLSAIFSKISGNYLIGFFNKEVPSRNGFYDFEFHLPEENHMTNNYFEIFSHINPKIKNSEKRLISLSREKPPKIRKIASKNKNLVGIHPCHEIKEKSWNKKNFAKVLDYLVENKKTPIVLGSPKEKPEVQKVISLSKYPKRIINLAGKTSIEELFSLMKYFEFFISNDGGIMHLAASNDIPTLGIFSAETPLKYAPFNTKSFAIDARNISDEESLNTTKSVIDIFLEK